MLQSLAADRSVSAAGNLFLRVTFRAFFPICSLFAVRQKQGRR